MLSPGQFHKRVPRYLEGNLRFRKFVLERAAGNRAVQAGLREACRTDILFFINVFCWTFAPHEALRKRRPFITWPCQEIGIFGGMVKIGDEEVRNYGILEAIEQQFELVIEKSREMGASWLCILVMAWLFLFHHDMLFLMISRNQDAVDAPSPDSLFWKIDMILEYLPDWLRSPPGEPIDRRSMLFSCPSTRSGITGQATTSKAGVGGRCTAMFLDEFSQIDEAWDVLDRTADTTKCRIFNFTHTGLETAAYDIAKAGVFRKLILHWSMHPEKARGLYRFKDGKIEILDKTYEFPPDYKFDMSGMPGGPFPGLRSRWYDAECIRRRSQRAIAMDLDIDPKGATNQFFDGVQIASLRKHCVPAFWRGELVIDDDAARPIGLVVDESGPLKLWLNLLNGKPPFSRYAAGADISTGNGATPSCFSVIDCRTGRKVAQYVTAHMREEAFATMAVALCWLFRDDDGNGARFCWEMQGPGLSFGKRVVELGYRNIYYARDEQKAFFNQRDSEKPGWYPSQGNKLQLFNAYREALFSGKLTNLSSEALEECLSFKHGKNGKGVEHAGAAAGNDDSGARDNHGDIATADALAWKMVTGTIRLLKDGKQPAQQIAAGSLAWRKLLHDTREREKSAWN